MNSRSEPWPLDLIQHQRYEGETIREIILMLVAWAFHRWLTHNRSSLVYRIDSLYGAVVETPTLEVCLGGGFAATGDPVTSLTVFLQDLSKC